MRDIGGLDFQNSCGKKKYRQISSAKIFDICVNKCFIHYVTKSTKPTGSLSSRMAVILNSSGSTHAKICVFFGNQFCVS